MGVVTIQRAASALELAIEMDRRGAVIERLEAQIEAAKTERAKAEAWLEAPVTHQELVDFGQFIFASIPAPLSHAQLGAFVHDCFVGAMNILRARAGQAGTDGSAEKKTDDDEKR